MVLKFYVPNNFLHSQNQLSNIEEMYQIIPDTIPPEQILAGEFKDFRNIDLFLKVFYKKRLDETFIFLDSLNDVRIYISNEEINLLIEKMKLELNILEAVVSKSEFYSKYQSMLENEYVDFSEVVKLEYIINKEVFKKGVEGLDLFEAKEYPDVMDLIDSISQFIDIIKDRSNKKGEPSTSGIIYMIES